MKTKNTRNYKWIEFAIVAWALVFVCTLTVMAATQTSTFSCFEVTASSSGEVKITPTSTGWSIEAYGTNGSCGSTSTQTVTITIKNTGKNPDGSVRGVSFKITTTGMETNDTGAAKTLDATTTQLQYKATSGKGASSSTTITIDFADILQASTGSSVTTTVIPKTGGTVTVDGTAVTEQTDFSNKDDHVYILTAAPASGYKFYGWMTPDGSLTLTQDADGAYSYPGQNAATLWPLFYKSDSAMYHIKNETVYYAYLDEAITAAGSTGTIVVCQSGTAYHSTGGTSFTIPKGVTLLLPYSASDLTVQSGLTNNASYLANGNYTFNPSGGEQSTTSGRKYTLTIPKGTTLNVANGTAATVGNCGRIVVGGKIASGNGSTIRNGATYKDHSNLVVNGTLNLGNYAVLATTGYVLGTGEIFAQGTGAQIYQPYVCMDFPGAAVAALAMRKAVDATNAQPSGEASVSPYIYWGVVNIQAKLTMKSGNFMYAYATLGDDGNPYHTNAVLVGNNATPGLLVLDSGATFYNEFKTITWSEYSYGLLGRNLIRIEGGASLGSLQLSLDAGWTSVDIDTESVVCPIGYNMDITLDGKYDYYIDKSMMLLPGARLTVAEDATLTIGGKATSMIRFAVWDGLIHRGYRLSRSVLDGKAAYQVAAAATRKEAVNYPTNVELDKGGLSEDADFVVNGKLVIDAKAAIGGIIQTDGNGTVEVKSGATTSVKVQSNIVDYGWFNSNHRYMASMSMFDSDAMLNLDGTLKPIEAGVNYIGTANSGLTNSGFTNKYYPGVDKDGVIVAGSDLTITYNSAETIKGNWHNTANIKTDDAVAPTCTKTGLTEGKHCSVCNAVLVAQEVIDKDPDAHNWGQDGLCTNGCGLFKIYASSVQVGDDLKLYFYVRESHLDGSPSDYKAQIVRYKQGAENGTTTIDGNAWTLFENGDMNLYRFAYDGIAAKEMTDDLIVTIYKKDENGNWAAASNSTTESVAGYAERYLKALESKESGTKDAALRTTLVDMLNYGAACQTNFENYNADKLANRNIDNYKGYATTDISPTGGQAATGYFYGPSVTVSTSLTYTFYFKESALGMTADISYQDHYGGKHTLDDVEITTAVTLTGTKGEKLYGIQVPGLAIADGRQGITCVLDLGDGTTETATWSVENYLAAALNTEDQNLKNVAQKLMNFVGSAHRYFHFDENSSN